MLKIEKLQSTGVAIKKTEYKVTNENETFVAIVTVSGHDKTVHPYVQQIKASVGVQKLEQYSFWSKLQTDVLTIHNKN